MRKVRSAVLYGVLILFAISVPLIASQGVINVNNSDPIPFSESLKHLLL